MRMHSTTAIVLRLAAFASIWIGSSVQGQTFNWPQWQGPDRNGLTKETGLLKQWPEGGPKRRWLFEQCGDGYSGPAIVDGTLYISGERDGACQLIAINADTGKERWATAIGPTFQNGWGGGPRNTPTVNDGRVYALSPTGDLVCLKADDGEKIWGTSLISLGGSVPNWGYSESVLVDGDKVLCTPGGPQGTIAAIDKISGDLLWQSKDLTDLAHYSSIVRGEIHRKPQYVQLLEKRLVGVSTEDGKLLWEVPWPGSVAVIPTPIILGNHVFATSGYGAGCMLVNVNASNKAEIVWDNKRMKNQHGGVIHLNKFIYGYSDEVGWVCLDARTGELAWRERDALGKGAIGYADGRFYCVDQSEGNVVLIDASPEGWTERGRFTLEPQAKNRSPRGAIWVHPVVVNGKLFLRDQEYLYCYDVKQ
jgi:outer membrane protein assembly factor BamB